VAVAAPGDHMIYVGRDGRFTTTGAGTSFAAALTAGTAALIRSRYPHMPWYEVDRRLIGTATPAGHPVPNDGYGYGIVNPARAVNASAYPVRASAPDPVLVRYQAWLATPAGAAVGAFVVVLLAVLWMSSRRSRPRATPAHPGTPGRWEERAWSFGPDEDDEYGGGWP
jgi:subtilisin family serine protease